MESRSAVITSATKSAWYADLIHETIEVTESPIIFADPYTKEPSEKDVFVLMASYQENQEKKNGQKSYKGISRGCLQFHDEAAFNFDF